MLLSSYFIPEDSDLAALDSLDEFGGAFIENRAGARDAAGADVHRRGCPGPCHDMQICISCVVLSLPVLQSLNASRHKASLRLVQMPAPEIARDDEGTGS
jgi:hypothetical protein